MCNRIVGRVCAFFCVCLFSLDGWGQWRFTSTLSVSGNCSDLEGSVAKAAGRALVDHHNGKTYSTREECERFRAMGSVVSDGACKVRIITTPCKGPGGSSGTNLLGPDKGSSFYSTNAANEIRDWAEDDVEKHLALDKNYSRLNNPRTVMTNDKEFDNVLNIDLNKPFRSLNIDEDGRNAEHSEDLSFIEIGKQKINNQKLKDIQSMGKADEVRLSQYLKDSEGLGIVYLNNPQDLSLMLQRNFNSLSGYDVNSIMNKVSRTDAEKQALIDYNEYVNRMCEQMANEINQAMALIEKSEEKNQIDMAILAKDCYGDDDNGYLGMTGYKRIKSDDLDVNNNMRSIVEAVEICNATHSETGFNAVVYYNENIGSYVIGCEGSSMPKIEIGSKYYPSMVKNEETGDITFSLTVYGIPLSATISQDNINDWGLNNIIQGFGGTAAQYELAHTIAEAVNRVPDDIRKDLDLSFVGHSLGGGLASVMGLATGKPTYTYNAEGVSDKILAGWGLLEKKNNKDYDITAYHTHNDILSNLQDITPGNILGASAIGNRKDIGNLNSKKTELIGTVVNAAQPGVGALITHGAAHMMEPMVEHFVDNGKDKQIKWEQTRYLRNQILAAKQNGSLQKVDSINIIL